MRSEATFVGLWFRRDRLSEGGLVTELTPMGADLAARGLVPEMWRDALVDELRALRRSAPRARVLHPVDRAS